MVKILMTIVLMAVIGGFIGAMTNFIAIRMLFRPYKAIYISKFRLPFTPGLIPKRRDELAYKIGQVVVNHLLTEETIANKLRDSALRKELIQSAQQFFAQKMTEKTSVYDWLEKCGFDNGSSKVKSFLETEIKKQITTFLAEKQQQKTEEVIPQVITQTVEAKLADLALLIMSRLQEFVQSTEGTKQINQLAENFLNEHGKLGSMIKMFVSTRALTEKIQKEAQLFLSQADTLFFIDQMVQKEWQAFKRKTIAEIISAEKQALLPTQITQEIMHTIESENWLDQDVQSFFRHYQPMIEEKWIPYGVTQILDFLIEHNKDILAQLDFAELIKKQIATFSLAEIEKLIIDISGRELKMITYLGAVLGALIGIIQGLLAIWM